MNQQTWLSMPLNSLPPRWIRVSEHFSAPPDDRCDEARSARVRSPDWYQSAVDRSQAIRACGLDWYVGWDVDRYDGYQRFVMASAHDPTTGAVRQRCELGRGTAGGLSAVPGGALVAVDRSLPMRYPAGVDVVRLDAETGAVDTFLPGNTIDITDHRHPLAEPPADVDGLLTSQLVGWEGWHQAEWYQTSTPRPTDGTAELVGSWPDALIRIEFNLRTHPGCRLRRDIRLFDELGRPAPEPGLEHVWLMEDIACGAIPPSRDAVDGTLLM